MGTGASMATKQLKDVQKSTVHDSYPDISPKRKSPENVSSGGYSSSTDNGILGMQPDYISLDEDCGHPIPGGTDHSSWSQTDSDDSLFQDECSRHAKSRHCNPRQVNGIGTIRTHENDSDLCREQGSEIGYDYSASFEMKNKSEGARRSLTRKVSYVDADERSHTIIDTAVPRPLPNATERSRSPRSTEIYNYDTSSNITTGDCDDGYHGVRDSDKADMVDLVQLVTRLLRENQVLSGSSNDSEGMTYCRPKTEFIVKVSVKPNSHVCEIILPEAMLFVDDQPTTVADSKQSRKARRLKR